MNELPQDPETGPYEESELALFRVLLLELTNNLEGAYKYANTIEGIVTDKIGLLELKAKLAQKLGLKLDAQVAYNFLLEINPDDHAYHVGLRWSHDLVEPTAENLEKLEALYAALALKFPKSAAVQRLPLEYATGALFEKKVDIYLRHRIRKGIPNLFRDVFPLYKNSEKAVIIENLLLKYLKNTPRLKFSDEDEDNTESPSIALWLLMFAAQHFDYYHHDSTKALDYVDRAIEHTPTMIDLYCVKARIFKHSGDFQAAHKWFEVARTMDLADRYLNVKSVEYACRADATETAQTVVSLFIRDANPIQSLGDLQAMWFELGMGESYARQGKLGKALKYFKNIEKHFTDFRDDQTEFHLWCMRKSMLRSYVSALNFGERVRDHSWFVQAMLAMARCYLKLSDQKKIDDDSKSNDVVLSKEEEKKKKLKERKAAEKAAKALAAELAAKSATEKEKNKGKEQKKRVDDPDPDGDQLLKVENPFGEVVRCTKILKERCSKYIETHILAAEVYLRKEKFLLVLHALKNIHELDKNHPQFLPLLVAFFQGFTKKEASLPPVVLAILHQSFSSLILNSQIYNFILSQLTLHSSSGRFRVGAAKSLHLLDHAGSVEKIVTLLSDISGHDAFSALEAYELLKNLRFDSEAEAFFTACSARFPHARFFQKRGVSATNDSASEPKFDSKIDESKE